MIHQDLCVISTITLDYTYTHTSLDNIMLLTFHWGTYTCAAHYFHDLLLSLHFNTHLQSITIILFL